MRFHLPSPPRRQHPLLRAASVLLGLAVLAILFVCGLFVASVLLVGGMVFIAIRQGRRAPNLVRTSYANTKRRPSVLEGEFVVLHGTHPGTR